jgi:hypothetical protein
VTTLPEEFFWRAEQLAGLADDIAEDALTGSSVAVLKDGLEDVIRSANHLIQILPRER